MTRNQELVNNWHKVNKLIIHHRPWPSAYWSAAQSCLLQYAKTTKSGSYGDTSMEWKISILTPGCPWTWTGVLRSLLFRRRLSAEGAKPESNNRWKSDLGHVCMWVGTAMYVQLCMYVAGYGIWNYPRAPLGYFYNAPHWGGGGLFRAPPLISETTGPILKIQAAFESPGKTVEGKQILLTSGSRVTSQVRSKSKCSTFRAWWHRRAKLRC